MPSDSIQLRPDFVNAALMLRIIGQFDRQKVEAFAEVSIALLDAIDRDPDVEANGDELDGNLGEDDYHPLGSGFDGPGCPISDPDCPVDDKPCDEYSEDGL